MVDEVTKLVLTVLISVGSSLAASFGVAYWFLGQEHKENKKLINKFNATVDRYIEAGMELRRRAIQLSETVDEVVSGLIKRCDEIEGCDDK